MDKSESISDDEKLGKSFCNPVFKEQDGGNDADECIGE